MILQRIDSRREGGDGDGALIDIYELRDVPDGDPVRDPARIERVLDGTPFRRAMEALGPTARATITDSPSGGPAAAGVLEVRARFDYHNGPDCIQLESDIELDD